MLDKAEAVRKNWGGEIRRRIDELAPECLDQDGYLDQTALAKRAGCARSTVAFWSRMNPALPQCRSGAVAVKARAAAKRAQVAEACGRHTAENGYVDLIAVAAELGLSWQAIKHQVSECRRVGLLPTPILKAKQVQPSTTYDGQRNPNAAAVEAARVGLATAATRAVDAYLADRRSAVKLDKATRAVATFNRETGGHRPRAGGWQWFVDCVGDLKPEPYPGGKTWGSTQKAKQA